MNYREIVAKSVVKSHLKMYIYNMESQPPVGFYLGLTSDNKLT